MTFYEERSGNYNRRHGGTKECETTCVYLLRYHHQELHTPDQTRCAGMLRNHLMYIQNTNMALPIPSERTTYLIQ